MAGGCGAENQRDTPAGFVGPAGAYDAYMGRYSQPLAVSFADFARVGPGQRVLDVGCGPGALTGELATRVGARSVAAADPLGSFVRACAHRHPDADVRQAPVEALPWAANKFDAVLAQLVIQLVDDPDAGIAEMRRVVRPGGTIAACAWEAGSPQGIHREFWDAACALDPAAAERARSKPFSDARSLTELWRRAGLHSIANAPLTVQATYSGFDDYWQSFLAGVGPGGRYCRSLDASRRAALREACIERLNHPTATFTLSARALAVQGTA